MAALRSAGVPLAMASAMQAWRSSITPGGGGAGSSLRVSLSSSARPVRLGDLPAEGLEPLACSGVVHGVVLERGVVAVDRGLLLL